MRALSIGIAVAAAAALTSSASANLLSNPGFETPPVAGGGPPEYFGATDWTDFGGGTFTVTSVVAPPNTGDQSMKMFGNPSGLFQQFPTLPGQNWDGGVHMLNWSGDPLLAGQIAAVNIEWIQADGVTLSAITPFISNGTFNAGGAAPADTWTLLPVSGAAPADAAFARLVLITGYFAPGEGPGGGAVFMDDAFMVPTPGAFAMLGLGGLAAARRRRR